MNKLLLLGGLGAGAYWLYKTVKTQPIAGALPADATLVKTITLLGVAVDVYLSSSGYYLKSDAGTKILGPYSQAQVSAALNAQNAATNVLASL